MAQPQRQRTDQELSELWRARLDAAKAAYDLAVAEFRRSAEEYRCQEGGSAGQETALRAAVSAENRAREHYLSVLQAFTDLVMNGKIPPEH